MNIVENCIICLSVESYTPKLLSKLYVVFCILALMPDANET